MFGIALFSEGRSPEENSNYASHRRSIISASTSKRVHGIFDLYPTKELIKKSQVTIDFYVRIYLWNFQIRELVQTVTVVYLYINAMQCKRAFDVHIIL